VSNHINDLPEEEPRWIQLELEFKDWPSD